MKTCVTCGEAFSDDLDFCPRDGTRLSAPQSDLQEQLSRGLARRFRMVRRLGEGGMGTVFLAEQIAVGNRPVALKVLLRKLLDDPEFLLRFQNEAASTGRIHHPNVVTIYESGQGDDGTPFIAMEYLEGDPLSRVLKARGALPVPECAAILNQVARGLNAAHKLGIIHRDLKPDNIFISQGDDGEMIVKVVDFGIAKLRESATHTLTGTVLGTPAYMSFEQASGMKSDDLDVRSDIYSLSVVAYQMLTGRVPFHSDTPLGYVRKHLQEEPPPFHTVKPDLPALPRLEGVVKKAMIKDREQRHPSVLDFAREFGQAAVADGVPAGISESDRVTVKVQTEPPAVMVPQPPVPLPPPAPVVTKPAAVAPPSAPEVQTVVTNRALPKVTAPLPRPSAPSRIAPVPAVPPSVAAPARKQTSTGWLMVTACAGLFTFGVMTSFLGATLPEFIMRLHLDFEHGGTLFSFLYFPQVPMVFLAGPLIDRFGKKVVLASGFACSAVALVGMSLAHSYVFLGALLILLGLGGSSAMAAANTLIPDLYPQNPSSALNLGGIFFGVGAVFFPWLVALMARRVGLAMTLWFIALLVGLVALMALLQTFPPASMAGGFDWKQAFSLTKNPAVILLGSVLFFYSALEISTAGWIRIFLQRDLGATLSLSGSLLTTFWVMMMVGRLIASGLVKKIRGPQLVLGCSIGAIVGLTTMALARNLTLAGIGIVLCGLCYAPVFPTTAGTASTYFSRIFGTVFGMLMTPALLSGAVVPPIIGYVAQHASVRLGVLILAAIAVLLLITQTIFNRYEKRKLLVAAQP